MSKVRYCPQLNVPAVLAMSNHHYPPLTTTTIAALISSTAGYQCKKEPSSSANRGQNTLHENQLFVSSYKFITYDSCHIYSIRIGGKCSNTV